MKQLRVYAFCIVRKLILLLFVNQAFGGEMDIKFDDQKEVPKYGGTRWYFDKDNLPVQKDGDRGDTANRIGLLALAVAMIDGPMRDKGYSYLNISDTIMDKFIFPPALSKIRVARGVYVRHPDGTTPYPSGQLPQDFIAAPHRFSRDQQIPIKVSLGFYSALKNELQDMWKAQKSRWLRYQNIDIPSPEHLGQYVRSFNAKWLWPVNLVGDVFMLGGTLVGIARYKINNDDVDFFVNNLPSILQARFRNPTPLSWLSRKLTAPYMQKAWDHYFREETGACAFNELYRPIIKELIEN